MNDSKQYVPDLKPVNSFDERCVNQCNLYPECPCGKYDVKFGIMNKQKADGCIVTILNGMVIAFVVIVLSIVILCVL